MAAEESDHDGRAATEASQQGRSAGGQGTGPSSDPGCEVQDHAPFSSPRPGTSAKPASRPSPTRPAPQSQSLFRSYGSNLPTSLTYINLSTRGSLPWRPAADMGTARREIYTLSPGFSRASESSPDAAGTATLSKARAPLSGRTHSRAPCPSQRKENSPRGSRRLLRDRSRYRTGRLAAPISATPDSGI